MTALPEKVVRQLSLLRYSVCDRGVDEQIAFLSTRVTLQPGDVIATGTPEGVGAFQDVSLANGDRVDIEIENVGQLSNVVEQV